MNDQTFFLVTTVQKCIMKLVQDSYYITIDF